MIVQRFLVGERLTFAHGFLGQRAIAPALADDAAQRGGRVVLDLLFHDRVHLAANHNGMRGAGVGARRHGGYVAGLENKESGGGRARTAGSDIGDHGHGRSDDLLDGLAHRVHETARRIQADHYERGIFLFGLLDGARQDVHGDRVDHAIHIHDQYAGRGRHQTRRRHREQYGNRQSRSHANINIPQPGHDCLNPNAHRAADGTD